MLTNSKKQNQKQYRTEADVNTVVAISLIQHIRKELCKYVRYTYHWLLLAKYNTNSGSERFKFRDSQIIWRRYTVIRDLNTVTQGDGGTLLLITVHIIHFSILFKYKGSSEMIA